MRRCANSSNRVPGLIQQGLDTLGVAPSLSLNGKAYYAMTDEVTQLLHEWLRMRRSNSGNAAWTADVDIPANYKPMG